MAVPRMRIRSHPAMRVSPNDPIYQHQARCEAEFWARSPINARMLSALVPDRVAAFSNQQLTGTRETTWLDDLIARGPFRRAAVLGSTEGFYEEKWLEAGASEELDVYELSSGVIEKARQKLFASRRKRSFRCRVRFFQADLNFVQLPRRRFDIVWSTGCLHHLINLEYLLKQVERSLRNEGLFAFYDYIGEARLRYSPDRLRQINEVLRRIPPTLRRDRVQQVGPPTEAEMSPFEAVRSDEILARAREYMDLVHLGRTGALFPLFCYLRLHSMENEAPHLIDRYLEAEEEAARGAEDRCCGAYAVFSKRR